MSTLQTASSPQTEKGHHRGGLVRFLTPIFNPLAMQLAGTRLLPFYGVIEHRGRRSGKPFRTPVVVRPVNDGFVVPMPWGERTDWYRNVRSAGGCVIRWKGRRYEMRAPEVLDTITAAASFASGERAIMTRFGIDHVLRLRFGSAAAS